MLFSLSNYYYSLLKFDSLPNQMQLIIFSVGLISIWILAIKIDFILGEIKYNLRPMKVFYYLIKNLKFKHKLTNFNYKKLGFGSRIVQFMLLDFGMAICLIIDFAIIVLISISTRKVIWIWQSILNILGFFITGITFGLWMCIVFVLFSYYKFRFDQINHQIKSIIPNGKVISKIKENQLTKLIYAHNSLSIEIHKLNQTMRRTAATMFLIVSICKIIYFYSLIKFNQVYLKIMFLDAFIILLLCGLGLSYLFSLQIKSAHQSHQLIYSVLCKYKMQFSFKLKVNSFKLYKKNFIKNYFIFS